MAIASEAWKRTAASRCLSSSMRGSSTTRTTICWFATPSRTLRGSPAAAAKLLRCWPSASRIGHLAVAHQPLGQVLARAARHAAAVDLRGGEVAAIDVETDAAAL